MRRPQKKSPFEQANEGDLPRVVRIGINDTSEAKHRAGIFE